MTSRVATKPITLPAGTEAKVNKHDVTIKGKLGEMSLAIDHRVSIDVHGNVIQLKPADHNAVMVTGTTRALLNNMVQGVAVGFERKLELVGVGYRAQAQGSVLDLAVGFSHPVKMTMPAGIKVETPSQTEIVIKGVSCHMVSQVAANIRAVRPPEPYKGKGIRYAGERIVLKEGKKK